MNAGLRVGDSEAKVRSLYPDSQKSQYSAGAYTRALASSPTALLRNFRTSGSAWVMDFTPPGEDASLRIDELVTAVPSGPGRT